ncbi:hypothetical protein [Pantoea sp. App145]|uniref:hypothetical protein n=1 Tax=Pantoea sp. App145 TaxID=3071567 RepID=UPI003A80AEE4
MPMVLFTGMVNAPLHDGLIGLAMVASMYGDAGLVLLFTVLAVHSLLLFGFQSLYSTLAGSEPFKPGVLMDANPSGVNVLGFSRSQQDSQINSSAICLTTLLSMGTLPVWIWVNALL